MSTGLKRSVAKAGSAQVKEVPIIRRKELEETIQELLAQPSPALLKARIWAEYGSQLHALREAGYPAPDVAQHYIDKFSKCSARTKKAIRTIFEDLFAASENGTSRPVSAEASQGQRLLTTAGELGDAGHDRETANKTAALEGGNAQTMRRDATQMPAAAQKSAVSETLEEQLMRSLAPPRDVTNAEPPAADQDGDK